MFVYFINDINKHILFMQIYAPFVITVFSQTNLIIFQNKNFDKFSTIRKSNEKQKKKIKKQSSNNLRYELRNNSFLTSKIIYSLQKNCIKENESNIFLDKNLYIYAWKHSLYIFLFLTESWSIDSRSYIRKCLPSSFDKYREPRYRRSRGKSDARRYICIRKFSRRVHNLFSRHEYSDH